MTGAHAHAVEAVAAGHSPVHRLDPRVKIVGLIGLAVVAATTPEGAWWAFAAYLGVLVALAVVARLPLRYVLARMTVELPFLAAVAALPLVTDEGLVLAGTLACKMTAGVLAMVVLSSTTPFPALLRGFEWLRVPRTVLLIVGFMWRYLHVLADDLRRLQIARAARGGRAGWLGTVRAAGALVATLFVRSLERGERVYLAMLSRGYDGGVPAAVGGPLVLRTADLRFGLVLAVALAAARLGAAP